MSDWNAEYKAKVREFMATHGAPVEFVPRRFEWQSDDEVSIYHWDDFTKAKHATPVSKYNPKGGCHWVVPEGAVLYERTYRQFDGTFTSDKDEHGVNVRGVHCACGRYTDVTLRWVGSVGEMLRAILDLPDARVEVTL